MTSILIIIHYTYGTIKIVQESINYSIAIFLWKMFSEFQKNSQENLCNNTPFINFQCLMGCNTLFKHTCFVNIKVVFRARHDGAWL